MGSEKQTLGKKEGEDIFVHMLLRPLSKYLTRVFVVLKIPPEVVCVLGFLIGIIAGYFFYLGDKTSLIYGAIIAYISMLLSASDGEVARATNRVSEFGDFLDSVSDIGKFWLFFVFLSLGVYRTTGDVFTAFSGLFASGAFLFGHYIRLYSYKVTIKKTYELRFSQKFAFYFTIFIMFLMIIAALLNQVKIFLIGAAIIYPLTWFKKIHTVYRFIKKEKV